MERFTVVAATTNGSLSQRPIFKGNSIPPKPQLRDASFSAYLRPEEPKPDRIGRNCRGIDDSEISIFEAERYFNEIQDQKENKKASSVSLNLARIIDRCDIPTIPRLSSVSSVDGYGRNYRTGSFHATPTASSEASWNSQSGLLSNPPGSIAVSMKNLGLDEKKKKGSPSSTSSSSSSTKWFFGRKCPCSGKKSVQVDEKFSEPKTPVFNLNNSSPNSSLNPKKQNFVAGEAVLVKATMDFDKKLGIDERPKLMKSLTGTNWVKEQEVATVRDSAGFSPENHFPTEIGRRVVPSGRSFTTDTGGAFSFPILNPPAAATKVLLNGGKPVVSQLEDPPRESLEVFRPTDESTVRKSTDLQRRVLMSFPEDSDRRSFTFPASPKIRPTDDDVVSDASSDLFEIESFSTQSTMYPMYRRRDSLDEISSFEGRRYGGSGGGFTHFRRSLDETTTPSIAPTECYEPSEVSIDWSVTTAEGFDRGSITNFSIAAGSDYEDVRFMNHDTKKVTMSNGTGTTSKRKGNGLLSCRCEKAVSVGPHPVKSVPAEQRHVSGQFAIESGRINPAMSRLSEMSSMHVGRASGKLPFARSHSARMSHQALTTR
ncbi:hypothetical protein BVC80_7853g8 [Macleaya cordata]|uniref:Phytochrome kinase substrate 1 n=1 Tax=Macleaya cordata TaxID=56857 RepID=A0A200PYP4_MACCD|nr:hypothetical protein BVC80_7853g8 [Macleaya cordata]